MKGKVVLDVGAGCGETAALFLGAGTTKAICIEPDEAAFDFIERNIKLNGWGSVDAIDDKFKPDHAAIP